MKDPKDINQIKSVLDGRTDSPYNIGFHVPTYKVTDQGIEDGEGVDILFCKGNKEDSNVYRQEGVFTESLLETSKRYLEMANAITPSAETEIAIVKLEEALFWLNKRAEDRKRRGVQGTYRQ